MAWAELENGIVEIKLFVEYMDGTKQNFTYKTQEGLSKYHDFMKDENIYFGRLIEVYCDEKEIRRCSFCHGK